MSAANLADYPLDLELFQSAAETQTIISTKQADISRGSNKKKLKAYNSRVKRTLLFYNSLKNIIFVKVNVVLLNT